MKTTTNDNIGSGFIVLYYFYVFCYTLYEWSGFVIIERKTIKNDESYLRQVSNEVSFGDTDYIDDIKLLERFCLETECFALAAIQIGIPKRIIYLKNTNLNIPLDDINHNESKILINPIVVSRRGHTKFWEACLSCLNNTGLVSRPYEMVVEYYNSFGDKCRETFVGFEATVLSHELDHLDGILHMDVAERVIELSKEERKIFREEHPYVIISKDCDYNELVK